MPNLIQGTDEWLAWRKAGIDGDDAAAIMGVSPWDTPYSIWRVKTGAISESVAASATPLDWGQLPHAREAYHLRTGRPLKPIAVESPEANFRRATIDGIADDIVTSIDTSSLQDHEEALRGFLPRNSAAKMQHLLLCMPDAKLSHYVTWRPGNGEFSLAIVEVTRDQAYLERLARNEDRFWRLVLSNTPPSDDPWSDAAWRWRKAKELYESAATAMEAVKSEFAALAPSEGAKREGGGVSFARSIHRGTVDYKALIAKLEITEETVEQFRKPGNVVETLRVKGDPRPPLPLLVERLV